MTANRRLRSYSLIVWEENEMGLRRTLGVYGWEFDLMMRRVRKLGRPLYAITVYPHKAVRHPLGESQNT